jgi:hypothetical protein
MIVANLQPHLKQAILLLLSFLGLEIPFPFGTFPRGFLALLHLPLFEEFSVCMFPLGPFFFDLHVLQAVVQCPMGADLSSTQ